MDEPFADLRTLDDVRRFVESGASQDPGPLMEHAVKIAGSAGLTGAELELLFVSLGQARFARGMAQLQVSPGIVQAREPRPNAGGLYQWQVVFRHR